MANIPVLASYDKFENEPEDYDTSAAPEQTTSQPQPVIQTVVQPVVQPPPPGVQPAVFAPQPVMMSGPYPAYPTVLPPYMAQSGAIQFMQPVVQQPQVHAVPRANLLPNDYLVITLVFFVLCVIFNITSIFLGFPALILSISAYNYKASGKYDQAKMFGNIAIYLTLANVVYTLVSDILIIGLTLGLHCRIGYYNNC